MRTEQMAYQAFWDIPPGRVIVIAIGVTIAFLGAAYCLYQPIQGAPPSMYKLKIADAFITGAIGGIFLASVRAIFGLPQSQWLASRSGRFVLAVIVYVI